MIRVRYLRDNKNRFVKKSDGKLSRGNPRVCIAIDFDRKNDELLYAVASVHPKDTFHKSRGRKIAEGRLTVSPVILKGVPTTAFEITRRIMEDLLINEEVSRTVRELAEDWLSDAQEKQ